MFHYTEHMSDKDTKVLILDDSYSHVEEFKKRLKTVGITNVTHISTAMGCIEKLMKHDYDLIFLDYDLGESPAWAQDIDNCGGSVSEWIQLNPDVLKDDTRIIIHSIDYLGATYMKERIPEAIIQPRAWEEEEFEQLIKTLKLKKSK